jgi:hypothetical protein
MKTSECQCGGIKKLEFPETSLSKDDNYDEKSGFADAFLLVRDKCQHH